MKRCYIAFGANQGFPLLQLQLARKSLSQQSTLREIAASSIYRSPPWGYTAQPDFYNAVIAYDSALSPENLLTLLHHIEATQHRQRPFKNAPRTLDLDLLLYEELIINTPKLILPHPRMHERAFVLEPLLEIAPEIHIPFHGKAADIFAALAPSAQQKIIDHHWAMQA